MQRRPSASRRGEPVFAGSSLSGTRRMAGTLRRPASTTDPALPCPRGSASGRTTVSSRSSTLGLVRRLWTQTGSFRRSALGPDEDVAIAVLDPHQRRLADGPSLIAGVGHYDHRQPGVAQGGALARPAPVPSLGDLVCISPWGPTFHVEREHYPRAGPTEKHQTTPPNQGMTPHGADP